MVVLGTERIAAAVCFRGGSDARQFTRAGAGSVFGAEGEFGNLHCNRC